MTASTSNVPSPSSAASVRAVEAPVGVGAAPTQSFRERASLRHRRALLARLRERVQAGPKVRLLDLGGGAGAATEVFAKGASEVVVLDPNRKRVARGRSVRPAISFVEGVAETLPFPDQRFERVVSLLSFHHLNDGAKALAEASRVLVPGGKLVVSDFGVTSWPGRLFRFLHRVTLRRSLSFTDPTVVDSWLARAKFGGIQRERVGSYFILSAEK
jgi:ubiquinone/menaquinone biosynthesis C-methylase UbiE